MLNVDPHFRVEVVSKTQTPQSVVYAALRQDYSENFIYDDFCGFPSEEECGRLAVKHLLAGNRGHFGCLEHPQIVLNCGWFPHSTMQQIRTHRVGVSFDVQSFRYSGQRIIDVRNLDRTVEEVFYLRPAGSYTDRQGRRYVYTEKMRAEDVEDCRNASNKYAYRVEELGFSEEHARGLIPFDVRQHWLMSANARSLMHLLDLRWKADAQLECQWLCDLIFPHFQAWVPAIAEWYMDNRAKKARLAP